MARTLSPANRSKFALVSVLALSLVPERGAAETPRQNVAQSNAARTSIKIKPIAPTTPPAARTPRPIDPTATAIVTDQVPTATRSAADSYRNPFSAQSDSPQSDSIFLPGPRSRWRNSGGAVKVPQRQQSPAPAIAPAPAPANMPAPASAPTVLQLTPPVNSGPAEPAAPVTDESSLPEMAFISDESAPARPTAPAPSTPIPAPAPAKPPTDQTLPSAAKLSAKTAILTASVDAATDGRPNSEDVKRALLSDAADAGPQKLDTPIPLVPPDPARYTTGPSNQPAWLQTPSNQTPAALPPTNQPLGRSVDKTKQELQNALRMPASHQDAEVQQTALEEPLPYPNTNASTIRIAADESGDDSAVIADYSDSPSGWLVEAQELARKAQSMEELLAVAQLCDRVTSANPQDNFAPFARKLAAWASNRRGELLAEANQTADALAAFNSAVESDPQNSLAIHNRAVTLAQQNDFDAALQDFNRVVELNPALAIAFRNRGELLAAQGQADAAIADYTHAIEVMPDDAELYRARAHAFHQLDLYERALKDLDAAIRIAPDAAQGYAERGNLLADRGDFTEAVDDFNHAITLDAKLADVHRGLAWIKSTCPDERHRDAFEALAAARKAVELTSPDDYLSLDVLAAAHANASEFDKAVTVQEQALRTAPADAAPPMRARLNLYERRQPYRIGR